MNDSSGAPERSLTPAYTRALDTPSVGEPFDLSAPGVNLIAAFLHRYDRENTRRSYRNDLRRFFGRDTVDAADVRQVSFLHVNQHIADLESEGLKPATLQRRLAAIRVFFEWLEAIGVVDQNPAQRQLVRRVRTAGRNRRIVFLTAQQARRLLDATDAAGEAALRDRALLSVLLHCVLRRSEAAAMCVEHVRPAGRHWVLELPQAKGGADQYVKMPEHVVELIEDVKATYGIHSGAVWRSLSNRNRGAPLRDGAIYDIVARTAARAALPEIGAHTLRHTGCTLAIEAGASMQQVQTHARHKRLETTMVYVHQRDKLANSAADFIQLDGDDG